MSKFITISNNDRAYQNNTNSQFTSNIERLALNSKKKYSLSLTDFSFKNSIKKNLGKIDIIIKNTTENEDRTYSLFIENLKTQIFSLKENLYNSYIKFKNFSKNNDSSTKLLLSNELKFSLIQLKNKYLELDNFILNNKTKSFSYFVYDIIKVWSNFKNIVQNNLEIKTIIDKENFDEDFNRILTKINKSISNIRKITNFQSDIIIYDKYSYNDFKNYLLDITKICSDFYSFIFFENKIILNIQSKFFFKCDHLIQKLFDCKVLPNGIEFIIRKKISFIESFYIYTDIIEDNELSNERSPLLSTFKVEGDYSDSITKSFKKPKNLIINKTNINSISIKITDQNKQLINFDYSPVLTLEIKEIR